MMKIKPIHSENDYKEALELASVFFDDEPELNSPEGNEFDILLTLIESYEAKHFPIDVADPIEAIKFRLEQAGKDIKDLTPLIGKMNRVYEVMSGTRPLSLRMIRHIHEELGVSAESLIREYALSASPKKVKVIAGKYVSRPRAQSKSSAQTVKLSSGKSIAAKKKTSEADEPAIFSSARA